MPSYEVKETLIRINDLGLSFGDKVVLRGINAEVRDIVRPGCITGQVVGLLGPSGIGKTLLSRILTGLQVPTCGTITVGKENRPIEAGLVGFVPQNYPLLRHRKVLSNLEIAARMTTLDNKTAAEKSMEYLRLFDLEDKWDQYPAELSGGQRQRVAIAQQLLCSEHYLVLDEPTTGLDPIMKDKVVELIRKVSNISEENTIFVVTHDIPAVMTVADQLWLLGRTLNENGESTGANIVNKYDLAERGIAWHPNPTQLPEFVDVLREVRSRFDNLSKGVVQ